MALKLRTRAGAGDDDQADLCPKCGGPRVLRQRKQKMLSYVLFASSFVVFIVYTSFTKISPTANVVWILVQFALAAWAWVDRRANAKPLFYCRTCNSRLPS